MRANRTVADPASPASDEAGRLLRVERLDALPGSQPPPEPRRYRPADPRTLPRRRLDGQLPADRRQAVTQVREAGAVVGVPRVEPLAVVVHLEPQALVLGH